MQLNGTSILMVSHSTLSRYEPQINKGTLFLFNAARGVMREANSDMNKVFELVDGERSLGEICDLLLIENPRIDPQSVAGAVGKGIELLYGEGFLELVS